MSGCVVYRRGGSTVVVHRRQEISIYRMGDREPGLTKNGYGTKVNMHGCILPVTEAQNLPTTTSGRFMLPLFSSERFRWFW
jgi:hypothetical protein